jgi:hypothetical protein
VLSFALRLPAPVCVASERQSHVASGRRCARLRSQAFRENNTVANAWNDGNPRSARLCVAGQRCAEVLNLAVDVQIRAARVEASGAHWLPGQMVWASGK